MNNKILILDDDLFQIKLLTQQLYNIKCNDIVSFTDANDTKNLLHQVGLIIFDLNMPNIDGIEFIRLLAKQQCDTAIILMSGEDERILNAAVKLAKHHHCKVIGAMQKPIQTDNLKALIQKWRGEETTAALKKESIPRKSYSATELHEAITKRQLVNVYQPKVSMNDGTFKGVETLVRWHHPTDGIVFPDQFISLAEESGLIDDLTNMVLLEALQQSNRWQAAGLSCSVGVNISIDNLI